MCVTPKHHDLLFQYRQQTGKPMYILHSSNPSAFSLCSSHCWILLPQLSYMIFVYSDSALGQTWVFHIFFVIPVFTVASELQLYATAPPNYFNGLIYVHIHFYCGHHRKGGSVLTPKALKSMYKEASFSEILLSCSCQGPWLWTTA